MSEEIKEEKKQKKTFGWIKNIISAVAGAVVAFAATIGIIGKSDAEIAKEKIDGWLNKTEVVYVQVESVGKTIAEVKALIADKKWTEALAKLDTIKTNATTTIETIKELREEITEAAKALGEEIKEKGEEIKDVVEEGKEQIKDAVEDKPSVEDKPAEP